MKSHRWVLISLSFYLFFGAVVGYAEDLKETIPYKLAILHIRYTDPEAALPDKSVEPSSALVSEFQWILEGLRNRCINPETAIADSIVETWQYVRAKGYGIPLLEIARQLSQVARNRILFGEQRVNFRMITAYWRKEFQAGVEQQKLNR